VENLDHILHLQLAVARLGERELETWWNTDIAYKLGGAGFLERIAGPEMAPFAAGEGVLLAARLHEESILESIPGNPCFSLFCPPLPLRNELIRRYHHFKRYPEDTPDEIRAILDVSTDWTVDALRALIQKATGNISPACEGTSFGREITAVAAGVGGTSDNLESMMNELAAAYLALGKGKYVLPYFRTSGV
jgi:hypothetical protein